MLLRLAKLWPHTTSASTTGSDNTSRYQELNLGVWRVLLLKPSPSSYLSAFTRTGCGNWRLRLGLPALADANSDSSAQTSRPWALLCRAFRDVYAISPRSFTLIIASHAWFAIEVPLELYLSNRLLFFIEDRISRGLTDGRPPVNLCLAVVARIVCSAFGAYIRSWSQRISDAYESRVRYEFQARLYSAQLSGDLQAAAEDKASRFDVDNVYRCLNSAMAIADEVTSLLLHLRMVINVAGKSLSGSNSGGGPAFLAMCLLPTVVKLFKPGDLWRKAYMAIPVNKFYIRKSALEMLSDSWLRQEVIAGGADRYLINEYRKAKDGLGDTSDASPDTLYSHEGRASLDIVSGLLSDAPTLYFASLALFYPSKLSLIQLAALSDTSSSLRHAFSSIRLSLVLWPSEFSRLDSVYAALDRTNKIKDGETAFPRPGYEKSSGMGIEMRNVSFSYPNSKSERAALCDVSFTIRPGQLVVIVGANGSGKSTIIKLLSRFYEPSSGQILVDGVPIEMYRMATLRRGIAMLTQEHHLFPLSVSENVRLGAPGDGSEDVAEEENEDELGKVKAEEAVIAAVEAAGAEGVVNNFRDGYETVLEPATSASLSFAAQGDEELEAMHKSLEKKTEVSGGELQKLVAARTFMRLFAYPVKLVTVDEPSSALDPESEYRLFANLRSQRRFGDGRTMIFVTHRFGHLTKYADLIVCIKDGVVVETGTHTDLLSKDGEYAHLYNIQAQAFASTDTDTANSA